MRLFSEKVKPTLTDSPLNILQVENFNEIFFNVYEVEINKTKYPVEKISEHNGNPVVSVPVVIEGKRSFYPFVLTKGKPEILFNENNIMENVAENFEIIKDVEYTPIEEVNLQPIFESKEESPIIDIIDNKKEILEQIEKAKLNAKKEVQKLKIQKQKELQAESKHKQKLLEETLHNARYEMVEEFVKISQKIKNELVDVNDSRFYEIQTTIDNKIQDLAVSLGESLVANFENSNKDFDSKLREMVKEMYSAINPKIDDELKNIATEIVEKVDTIEKNLESKLDIKADKTLLEGINREMDAIRDGNIELNDRINKGVNKSLSRVGNVDKKVDDLTIALSEDIESKIQKAEENITNYYNEKLQMLEEKTFNITEETRKYIIGLVQESRNNLIEELRKLKNEKPIEYIVESKGKPQKINSDDLLKDVDKRITARVDNEVTRLRKYIAVYSGGGSVAQQFADGGTMNGNLTVVGSISASQYLGLSIPSGDYLPLSGGTITGDLAITGDITTVDSIQFDTAAGVTVGEGQLAWNSAESTLNIGVNDEVTLQVGQETLVQVKASETIRNGQVVYASGAAGSGSGNITVSAYRANASGPDEMYMLGVATQELTINEYGFITTFGKVRDVSVEFTRASDDPEYSLPYNQGWEIGTVLYVSAVDRGRFTSVPPTAPDKKMPIVMVLAKSGNTRIFFVRAEHGYHLNELHDVKITNLSANDILSYNASSNVWCNTRDLIVDSLSANVINALSANITVIDIKQYELSGFNVQGNATVQGTISATGPIYSNGNQVATVVDPVRTTLTGNGVLSTFAISGANTLVNPSALIVAIDGALQEPVVDYTVLSGSITFTSPLPSGSKAVVISPTNSLQVSQMIPADGSVTSAKLDNSLLIQNLTVANTTTLSGGINTAPSQTYSSLDSILTPRVNAGLRGYIINRRCNVGGTWSTSHASGGGSSSNPSHLQCYNGTTLGSKSYSYEQQASLCPLGTATTNGYSQFKWDMSEMWFDWVFNLTYAINSTGIRTNQLVKLFAGNADTEGMIRNYGGLGVYIVSGSSATNYDIRIFHGFGLPYYRAAISAATNASPIVITQNSHGFVTNDQIEIDGCVGNTAANGIWTVTRIDNNTYSLNGSTGNGTWTSGGNSHYISNVLLNTDALNTKLARILIHKTGGVFNVWLNDTILLGSVTYVASGNTSTAPHMGYGILGQMAKTLVASTGSTNMYLYELNYGGKD